MGNSQTSANNTTSTRSDDDSSLDRPVETTALNQSNNTEEGCHEHRIDVIQTADDFTDRFLEEYDHIAKGIVDKGHTKRIISISAKDHEGYKESSLAEVLKVPLTEDVENWAVTDLPLWFDFTSPSKQDMQLIEDKFELHPLTTEDILMSSRDKIEVFNNYIVVVIKEPHHTHNAITTPTLTAIFTPTVVLTFHPPEYRAIARAIYKIYITLHHATHHSHHPHQTHHTFHPHTHSYIQQDARRSSSRLVVADAASPPNSHDAPSDEDEGPLILGTCSWILWALLDSVGEILTMYSSSMVLECEVLDELVLVLSGDEQNDLLRRIGNARRMMTALRNQLWAKKEILLSLTSKGRVPFMTGSVLIYLRDVMDDCLLLEQRTDQAKETLNNLHSTYLARISIEMAEASESVSHLVKRFSVIATLFAPLSVVTGIFGMNVTIPGQTDTNPSLAWFFGIIGAMIGFFLLAALIFRYRRIL